jgi:glycerophosphoryl diester phosphodiesterase
MKLSNAISPRNLGTACRLPLAGFASYVLVLAAQLILMMVQVNPAHAQSNPLNGASPRPFYVFAHNPNTIADVERALRQGANALEPDIISASFPPLMCGPDLVDHLVDCDSDIPFNSCGCNSTHFVDWLKGVHELAVRNPQLALVVFDVKSSAANAIVGSAILKAIRAHLNTGGVKLNFIISVATKDDLAVFADILPLLREREGVMVDDEDDAGAVANYFLSRGYDGNIGYGDGTSGIGPHLGAAIDGAAWLRATTGFPRSVTYVYTIDDADSMRTFIDAGVDGIITNEIPRLMGIVQGRSDIRLATREDNPFQPMNEAYGLKIRTGDDGTDADITFTLEGSLGSATITVNTDTFGRMESGHTNFVTIPSRNLGTLKSITVENDGSGNRPNWLLQDITVQSAHWLKPDPSYHYTATLNGINRGHGFDNIPFRLDEFVWGGFAAASDGTIANPRKQVGDAYNEVAPGGIIHVAASRYSEKLNLTKPCTLEFWRDHGTKPAVIGNP